MYNTYDTFAYSNDVTEIYISFWSFEDANKNELTQNGIYERYHSIGRYYTRTFGYRLDVTVPAGGRRAPSPFYF